MASFSVRPLGDADREAVRRFVTAQWGSEIVISRGHAYRPHEMSGFVAEDGDGAWVGLVTYRLAPPDACEVMTLDSLRPGMGIGSALIASVRGAARQAGGRRLWLITTNDNLNALRFYQKRGFVLAALYPNALAESRRQKPEIPLVGFDGIPLRDEIELEMALTGAG